MANKQIRHVVAANCATLIVSPDGRIWSVRNDSRLPRVVVVGRDGRPRSRAKSVRIGLIRNDYSMSYGSSHGG